MSSPGCPSSWTTFRVQLKGPVREISGLVGQGDLELEAVLPAANGPEPKTEVEDVEAMGKVKPPVVEEDTEGPAREVGVLKDIMMGPRFKWLRMGISEA